MKTRLILTLILFTTIIFTGCYVERVTRPEIRGGVYDSETRNPIGNATARFILTEKDKWSLYTQCCDTVYSNKSGKIKFKKRSFREWTAPGMEASRVLDYSSGLVVEQAGYQADTIDMGPYKNGGKLIVLDTIYLKKAN